MDPVVHDVRNGAVFQVVDPECHVNERFDAWVANGDDFQELGLSSEELPVSRLDLAKHRRIVCFFRFKGGQVKWLHSRIAKVSK